MAAAEALPATTRDRIARLLEQARAAARPAPGPERPLAAGNHAARRAAILAEIDETMLARALDFRLGVARLTIEARNRRALGVNHVDGAGEEAEALRARLAAGGLAPEEECAALAGLIHLFSAAEGALRVISNASALPPGGIEKGHAAAGLAAAAPELAIEAPAPGAGAGSGLRAVHDAWAAFARAGALADAEAGLEASHGSEAAARLAEDLAASHALPGAFVEAAIPGPKLIVLGSGPEGHLCLAAADGDVLVAEIAAADLDAAIGAWRAARD